MGFKSIIGATCICLAVVSFNSNAALLERLGGQAYFDDVLNITWTDSTYTANADTNGLMNWADANTWVDNLTVGGKGGWRLPSVDVDGNGTVVDCSTASEADCRDNELAYMFFQNRVSLDTPTPFNDLSSSFYWSETVAENSPIFRLWVFEFQTGFLLGDGRADDSLAALAVYNGDISAVPVPAAVWLFGSGLIGLIGVARKKNI